MGFAPLKVLGLVLTLAVPRLAPSADLPARTSWERPPLFTVPAAGLDAALPAAAVLTSVQADSPAGRAGLRVGDRLIAIDGCRVHDLAELRLYQAILPGDVDRETWTVSRDGALLELLITGLDAALAVGVDAGPPADEPGFPALLERCGLPVAEADRPLLAVLPGRLAHALREWLDAQPEAPRAPPWLAAIARHHLAALRGGKLLGEAGTVPVDLLSRYDAFLHAIAVRGDGPVPAAAGVDRFTAALWYPYPPIAGPEFGKPALGDDDLVRRLGSLVEDPVGSLAERRLAAGEWSARGDAGAERFLGQVAAALLDPPNHGGWPFRSSDIWTADTRAPVVAELRRRIAADAPDADLAGFALVGPLTMDAAADEVVATVERLRQRSPYLAWRASETVRRAAAMHHQPAVEARLAAALAKQPLQPPSGAIYRYCLGRSAELVELGGLAGPGLAKVFRSRPDLVAAALAADAPEAERWRADRIELCGQLNDVAWAMATDGNVLDPDGALEAARQLRQLRGRHLRGFQKDAVAACYARAGDFATAVRWLEADLREGGNREQRAGELRMRLALYQAGRPFSGREVQLVPTQLKFPDGSVRLEGFMAGDKRSGRWRAHYHGGAIAVDGMLYQDAPVGRWRTYAADGTLLSEGLATHGHHVGLWTTFHPNGKPASAGMFELADDDEQRVGPWEWRYPDGQLKEAGGFSAGKRDGLWRAWSPDGTLLAETHFLRGRQVGPTWPGTTTIEDLPPLQIEVVTVGADDF
jgi:antitoxin component YwqK of YwqJK toxin-antitoxin module